MNLLSGCSVSDSALAFSIADVTPDHSGLSESPGRRPEVCVSRCRMVTAPLPFFLKSGIHFSTRSSRPSFPCSISSAMAGAVAMTFVNDAASKIVSAFIGDRSGLIALSPNDFWKTAPALSIRTTAPGAFPASIACPMAESISSSLAKRNTEESGTGLAGGGAGGVWQPTIAKLRTMSVNRFMR